MKEKIPILSIKDTLKGGKDFHEDYVGNGINLTKPCKKSYNELLKSPHWQRKRLEIMERDDFQCQCCLSMDKTLAVHHMWYKNNKMPWEYPLDALITLCDDCHKEIHEQIKKDVLSHHFLSKLFCINIVWIVIYKKALFNFINEKPNVGIHELIKFIRSQTLTESEI